jgi:hypothetical protein
VALSSFDTLRSLYSIQELAGMGHKRWSLCPMPFHIHHKNTPSFSVYFDSLGVQRFKCHGTCGAQGDSIDFVGFMRIPGYRRYDRQMYHAAAEILTGGGFQVCPVVRELPAPRLPPQIWQETLPPTRRVIEYALRRGLTQAQIDTFKIGALREWARGEPYLIKDPARWMTIPTFHAGTLMGIKLRNVTGEGLRYMALKGSRKGLFNFDAVHRITRPVLLLKG